MGVPLLWMLGILILSSFLYYVSSRDTDENDEEVDVVEQNEYNHNEELFDPEDDEILRQLAERLDKEGRS